MVSWRLPISPELNPWKKTVLKILDFLEQFFKLFKVKLETDNNSNSGISGT